MSPYVAPEVRIMIRIPQLPGINLKVIVRPGQRPPRLTRAPDVNVDAPALTQPADPL